MLIHHVPAQLEPLAKHHEALLQAGGVHARPVLGLKVLCAGKAAAGLDQRERAQAEASAPSR